MPPKKKTKKQILNDAMLRLAISAKKSGDPNERKGIMKIIARHAGIKKIPTSKLSAEFDAKVNATYNYYMDRLKGKSGKNWDIPPSSGAPTINIEKKIIDINSPEFQEYAEKIQEQIQQKDDVVSDMEYQLQEQSRETVEKLNELLGLKQGEKVSELFENREKFSEWIKDNMNNLTINKAWKNFDDALPIDETDIEVRNNFFIGRTYDYINTIKKGFKDGTIKLNGRTLDYSSQFYQLKINKDGNITHYRKINYNNEFNSQFSRLLGIGSQINADNVKTWKIKKQDLILFDDGSYNATKLKEIAAAMGRKKSIEISVFDKDFKFIDNDGNFINIR